ncbi:MAG: type II toxin-antitoxin system YafQ family toxin [Gammaproteobacteria bacterium]|nr:type II toxin-antitoxin system YafQ family toxin [Gammaproteobacteria bacterium]
MLNVKVTNSMKKDLKRMAKRQKSVVELEPIIENLARNKALPKKYKDHALSGEWSGYRECHIQPDWLLIYQVKQNILYLARTGTHSDLFR